MILGSSCFDVVLCEWFGAEMITNYNEQLENIQFWMDIKDAVVDVQDAVGFIMSLMPMNQESRLNMDTVTKKKRS